MSGYKSTKDLQAWVHCTRGPRVQYAQNICKAAEIRVLSIEMQMTDVAESIDKLSMGLLKM